MANTKFGLVNLLTQAATVLKNGTGGGAPALIETAPYAMANLKNASRYTIWKSSSLTAATQYNVDFNLGSAQSISAAAALGYRLASGENISAIDVYYQTGVYAPAGTWNYLGTIVALGAASLGGRDSGVEFGAVSASSVRFTITVGASNTVFSLGNFFVGLSTDLGGIHSPEGSFQPFGNRLETTLPSGATVLTGLGDDGATWRIPWSFVQSAMRATYLSVQALSGGLVLIDAEGNFFQVFLVNRAVTQTRPANALYGLDAEFKRLA